MEKVVLKHVECNLYFANENTSIGIGHLGSFLTRIPHPFSENSDLTA